MKVTLEPATEDGYLTMREAWKLRTTAMDLACEVVVALGDVRSLSSDTAAVVALGLRVGDYTIAGVCRQVQQLLQEEETRGRKRDDQEGR